MTSELTHIVVRGARQHNLKSIDLEIPKGKLVVFSGLSGSGKSSLAFDTLYAEGQRRYIESLSAYARQFLGQLQKPLYDYLRGLQPTISVEQKTRSRNPRSTVGTVTEIHDYLRVLYARVGKLQCYRCGREVGKRSAAEVADDLLSMPEGTRALLLAPMARQRKGTHAELFDRLQREGFLRVRIDGELRELAPGLALAKKQKHDVDLVVDRIVLRRKEVGRLTESLETALRYGSGLVSAVILGTTGPDREELYSERLACAVCGAAFPEITPQLFSFNSPQGMCPECHGLGTVMAMDPDRIVPDDCLSVEEGALAPWGALPPGGGIWNRRRRSLLRRLGVNFKKPWRSLAAGVRNQVLYGSGQHFEGLVPGLMKSLRESMSEDRTRRLARYLSDADCSSCQGTRLRVEARSVRVGGMGLPELCSSTIGEALARLAALELDGNDAVIGAEILKEVVSRLSFLVGVGLDYLTLDRLAPSLSGGESQRIRLASQMGSELTGVLYVLDEPSIGMHQKDCGKLLEALKHMRDIGNSIIVVEHDRETIMAADWLVDFGPGAGVHGGEIVEQGPPEEVASRGRSLTASYLSGTAEIPIPAERRAGNGKKLVIEGATENNLKDLTVAVPLGLLTCVTGVSGAGKSTLVNGVLKVALRRKLASPTQPTRACRTLRGVSHLDKLIVIDQSPIGRTPRSNPATYTKLLDPIRRLFSLLPESRARGYEPGRFSFNVRGGRCEACGGAGVKQVEMHFLSDVFVTCEVCRGKRFNQATLEVRFRGRSIADLLDLTVEETVTLFRGFEPIRKIAKTLEEVGLGYLKLGQPSPTLSGGEAQRIKLSRELAKRDTGRTLYLLDEPTTGLHFDDVLKLLAVLDRLVEGGNSVLVIEHNPDVIKCADWIIDLGPDGGDGGGRVVAQGTPEEVAATPGSYTGEMLRDLLAGGPAQGGARGRSSRRQRSKAGRVPDRARRPRRSRATA